nr:hypothetical protein [Lachnospiraceae bacterium]
MNRYFEYIITNIEPVRIADNSKSQSGQTVTLKYITGTAIRGLVVNYFAKQSGFEEIKPTLFSDKVKYLNAYLYSDKDMIVSPKGFYEDKTEVAKVGNNDIPKKQIENVTVDGNFTDGLKRASLGEFCFIEDGCIRYASVDTNSDMRISVDPDNDNIFRN